MELQDIWKKTVDYMSASADDGGAKNAFLNMLTPLGIFGNQFVLIAENAQVETFVKRNYTDELNKTLSAFAGMPMEAGITARSPLTTGMGAMSQPSVADQPAPQPQPAVLPQFQQALSPEPVISSETAPSIEPDTEPAQPDFMNTYVRPSDLPKPHAAAKVSLKKEPEMTQEEIIREATGKAKDLFARCTFESFVTGPSNEFAYSAAVAVAEEPGTAYNPLFIYGSSGLGKTHLLIAIANYVMQNFPGYRTVYTSADDFLAEFVDSTQKGDFTSFNNRYHRADLLLVDDVQTLEGKEETINQLFNIFNEMTNQNKQIVLSADRAPKDIDMDDRMRSRFMSGLLADIKPPVYETRLAIIRNYLLRVKETTDFNANIPPDVLGFLAETSTSNIREMEGAVTRLVSYMKLSHNPTITIDGAREVLKDFFPNTVAKQISIQTIQNEVERYFGISHDELIGSKRQKAITIPRHIAIYLSRYLTEESLESIGKRFGNRDHTTVMHSVTKIEHDMKDNRSLYDQISQLTTRIKERS